MTTLCLGSWHIPSPPVSKRKIDLCSSNYFSRLVPTRRYVSCRTLKSNVLKNTKEKKGHTSLKENAIHNTYLGQREENGPRKWEADHTLKPHITQRLDIDSPVYMMCGTKDETIINGKLMRQISWIWAIVSLHEKWIGQCIKMVRAKALAYHMGWWF